MPLRIAHALRRQWLQGALIALLTVLAYQPAVQNGFVWDDDDHVTGNETLVDANGLRRIWLERGAIPQYYPLVHTSFWVERHLWGLDPAGYHITNILLHGLAAILLWRVLVRLDVAGGFLAALIFALHPVGVESVAWITERKNLLSAVFYLAATLAWLKTQPFGTSPVALSTSTRPRTLKELPDPREVRPAQAARWYIASFVLFVAALLSKTVVATLPAAFLLLVWWKRGRITWPDLRPLLPFFAVGIALGLNTALMERTRVGAVGSEWAFSLPERLLIAGRAAWFYVAKLVWPANLTFIYPRWALDARSLQQWLFPIGAVAVVVLLFVARHRIGRGPLTAVLFFGGALVPALGFVNVYPMRFSFVADHFQYLASIGIIALLAAVLATNAHVYRAAFVLPVALGALTWRQTHVYRDLETLWTDTIRRNPAAWIAHNNLGNIDLARGDVRAAIDRYREAVRLKPDYYEALGNLGAALLRYGAVDEARRYTEEALRLSPRYTPALVTRAGLVLREGAPDQAISTLQDVLNSEPDNAEALNTLGSAYATRGDTQNAERSFETAIRVDPALTSARTNLARVLMASGRLESASHQVDLAIASAPNDVDARVMKGMVLMARGQSDAAVTYFRQLAQALPDEASPRFYLGTILSQSGAGNEAIAEFLTAIRLNPNHAEARNNLGIAYLIAERYGDAAEQFQAAIRIRGNNPEAYNNLAYAQIRLGHRAQAEVNLREALRLRPGYPEALRQLQAIGRTP